jgi:uncharacterized protein
MVTPRQVFDRMREHWLSGRTTFDEEMLAEDVVIESPFTTDGPPHRLQGRAEVLAYTRAGHAAVPFSFDGCRTLAVHQTADPETIVVEYELSATMRETGVTGSAPFIAVLTVHEGRIKRWREYQNPVVIARAMQG